jgi:hypothetical protein
VENDTVRTIEAPGPGSIPEEIARQGAQRMLAQAMEAEMIVVTVLAYNFVGDGLRDAADPYA